MFKSMLLKRIIFVLFFLVAINVYAQSDSLFNAANEAYKQKKYEKAIELYSDLVSAGYQSASLYYNLGNAYFKNNQLSKSILWYERALRLEPSNEDIIHNIAFANKQIVDEMDVLPEFFLKRWIKSFYNIMSSTGWAITSVVFSLLLFSFLAVLLLTSHAKRRVAIFFSTIILALLMLTSITFAIIQKNNSLRKNEAVVTHLSVTVKSMPDQAGTDLFTIHEGLKVTIVDKVGDWIEVLFPDGNKGWIQQTSVEVI